MKGSRLAGGQWGHIQSIDKSRRAVAKPSMASTSAPPRCPKEGTLPSTRAIAGKASSASVRVGAGSPAISRAPQMLRGSGAGPLAHVSASPRRPGPLPLEGVGGRRRGADGSPSPTTGGTRHASGPSASSQIKCQSFGCDPFAFPIPRSEESPAAANPRSLGSPSSQPQGSTTAPPTPPSKAPTPGRPVAS